MQAKLTITQSPQMLAGDAVRPASPTLKKLTSILAAYLRPMRLRRSTMDIIRAWKDEKYRLRLTEEQRGLLLELSDADLEHVMGGRSSAPTIELLFCDGNGGGDPGSEPLTDPARSLDLPLCQPHLSNEA